MSKDLTRLLVDNEFAVSMAESRKLILQGAVQVDGEQIIDVNHFLLSGSHVIQVAKRSKIEIKIDHS